MGCDKKCTSTGELSVPPYSFTVQCKKGKCRIKGLCSIDSVTTTTPSGTTSGGPSGSGSGQPGGPSGSGSGSGGPGGPSGSGSGQPGGSGSGQPGGSGSGQPGGAGQGGCGCSECGPGFTRVCSPEQDGSCGYGMEPACPLDMMTAAAGNSQGEPSCHCVPDFMMSLYRLAMYGYTTATSVRGKAMLTLPTAAVKIGKKTCKCSWKLNVGTAGCGAKGSSGKCDKKCSGAGSIEVEEFSLNVEVKKGKVKIKSCEGGSDGGSTGGPGGPGGSGSGSGMPGGPGGSESGMCACVPQGAATPNYNVTLPPFPGGSGSGSGGTSQGRLK